MPKPFRIDVPQDLLDDLQARLEATRWPDPSPHPPWVQGTPLDYLQELVGYWRRAYDWRLHEAALNGFAQLTEMVDGQLLHAIHERSPHEDALPLLIVHGWPGSVYEFHKLIPRLTHPERFGGSAADAFHVVAPSLPGYGWSAPPREPGMTPRAVGRLMSGLMAALGYTRYAVQGGDWGAVVVSWIAFDRPEPLAGLHLNMAAMRPHTGEGSPPLSEDEQAFLARQRRLWAERGAYQAIQGTRPQTLSYGLSDSPAGLAGWIVEKFRDWSDCDGDVEKRFTKDELLTNIMIYWCTGSIGSSVRLYHEHAHAGDALGPGERVQVPTAYAGFPAEIIRPPRTWIERAYNLQRYTEMPAGGHFAALEEPERLAEDLRAFFADRRDPT